LAERAGSKWAYIDAGVFHGLFEACPAGGGFPFRISPQYPDRPEQIYNIGGPTCDSFDLPFEQRTLPELRIGDRLAIHTAGAYSTEMSSTFNGFMAPDIYTLSDLI
jgi:ornithine decarboxylase